MTREKVLVGLGVLVIISPWSGLPLSWLLWILPLIGIVVLGIGVTLHMRSRTDLPAVAPRVEEHTLPPSEPPARNSHIAFS